MRGFELAQRDLPKQERIALTPRRHANLGLVEMNNTSNRSECFERSNTGRLATYCTLTLGACALGTVSGRAEIVNIDIAAVGLAGPNAGLSDGSTKEINLLDNLFGSDTGHILVVSRAGTLQPGGFANGFFPWYNSNFSFATTGGVYACPANFSYGSTIDGNGTFPVGYPNQYFAAPFSSSSLATYPNARENSPDFAPGSYMGFRFGTPGNYHYGWLEVQWNQSTSYFEVFSGAYDSTPNVAILAGAVAVPEPRSAAALGVLALGGAAVRRYRKARRERATSESEALAGVHS